MSRAVSNCNVRHEWLLDNKYKNWAAKDHSNDQKLARFKVCTDCSKICLTFCNFTKKSEETLAQGIDILNN